MNDQILMFGTFAVVFCILFFFYIDYQSSVWIDVQNSSQEVAVGPGDQFVDVEFTLETNQDEVLVTEIETNCDCAVFNQLPFQLTDSHATIKATIDLRKNKLPVLRKFRFFTVPISKSPIVAQVLINSNSNND